MIIHLKSSKIVIKFFLKDLLVETNGFKYQITLCVLLSKVKSSDLIEYSPIYLNSLTKTVIGNKYFLDQCFNEIIFRLEQWISHGSGWIVEEIVSQYLNISSYRPLSGSTYCELPKKLKNSMKDLINIQNNDNKCFLSCHVRHLNCTGKNLWRISGEDKKIAENLNYSNADFPVSKKDYCKISKMNKININVFPYEDKVIYKPPNAPFDPPPRYEHPAIYSEDFNCHHISWGYSRNDPDGVALCDWTSTIDLKLLYDPNQPKSFHSAAWNTFTNPDLTFYRHDINSSLPHPVHNVIGNFPKSQHRPTIIHHPALIEYTPTTPLPCWSFNKADGERFQAATRNICDDLPLPESDINMCFSEFQKRASKIAKGTIPRGFRKNYIPIWDTTCDELASRLEEAESPEEKLLSSNRLINHLNSKRKEEWISTVENVDMKRSS